MYMIEKLEWRHSRYTLDDVDIKDKINEIIDVVNEFEKNKFPTKNKR